MAVRAGNHVRVAAACACLVSGLGLLLSGPAFTNAATDSEPQAVGATVTTTIEWNPATCTNAALTMPAQSFSVAAGGSQTSAAPSVGCVSSNATWDVAAQMTTNPASGGNQIPASAFRIQRLDASGTSTLLQSLLSITGVQAGTLAAGGTACTSTTCTLDASRLIVDDAAANTVGLPVGATGISLTGGVFAWQFTLTAPSSQPAGNYTGGVVTLTASN